jgi:hypothetical protein
MQPPASCDSCDAHFTLQHALGCKKGELVIFYHNKIQYELVHLAGKAFTPSAIRDESLIHGNGTEKVKPCPTNQAGNNKPVKRITSIETQGFWACRMECIVDVQVTDTYANSYQARDPSSVLKLQEKKQNYLTACLEQYCHFTPFMVLTDGMMGHEASTFAKHLPAKLAEKWQKPYL